MSNIKIKNNYHLSNKKLTRKRKYRSMVPLTVVLVLFFSLLPGCGTKKETAAVTQTGIYFDTVISITLYEGDESASYIEDCFALASKYEGYFSNTIDDSDISKINASPGTPIKVHPETIALLKKGIAYGDISHGAFDITIGSLSDLWNFGENTKNIPSNSDISAALSTIDYRQISVEDHRVTLLTPNAKIDLGGIAKGYIADEMKAYLNEAGITSGIINLGGNVLTIGPKDSHENYTIAIQKPFSQDGEPIAAVGIKDGSVVTSGTYQRYFQTNDTLYHHILDVTTGFPYDNGLSSVTIINHSSVDGDGLSTTCFAMGLEDGMAYIETLPDTEAIFITNDGKLFCTSGIGTTISFTDLSK